MVLLGAFFVLVASIVALTGGVAYADVGGSGFPTGDCAGGTVGYKIQVNIDGDPPTQSFDQAAGVAQGDMTFGSVYGTPPGPTYTPVITAGTPSGWYLDYEYTGSDYELTGIFFKIANSGSLVATTTNPGTVEFPLQLSHITFCFDDPTTPTTTTTLPPTTTTTIAGPTTTTTTLPPTTTTTSTSTSTTTTSTSTTTTTSTTIAGPTTTTTTVAGPTTTTTVPETTTTTRVLGPTTTTTVVSSTLPFTGGPTTLGGVPITVPPWAFIVGGLGMVLIGAGLVVIASGRERELPTIA